MLSFNRNNKAAANNAKAKAWAIMFAWNKPLGFQDEIEEV